MDYPEEVLTKTRKGKVEARVLQDYGRFVRYKYVNPETGDIAENKIKLVLGHDGDYEEYFIIPLKQKDRYLLLKASKKPDRKLWHDGKILELSDLLLL